MPDLLIELFSEEIPARMQGAAREALRKLVTDGLVAAGLTYEGAAGFSTPRRLTLTVQGLTATSAPVREERKGPATSAPDAAIEGFLRSTGLSRDQLEVRDDKKGQAWFAVVTKPGRRAPEIIAEVLAGTIRNFPWPKSMRWGTGTLRWVRPLHSILCILTDEHGAEIVPLTVDDLTAGNTTRGHRFLAPAAFAVSSFDDYAAKLKRAHVVLDSAEREAHIWADATNAAFAAGLELVEDKGLLTEVAGLVEWPVVLMGGIHADFLGLPPEVLQTSMKEHQKFFSVRNPKTGRIEGFITVANIETADHGATILKGNQKVLSARLSDAKFFWENDLRTVKSMGLEGMAEGLRHVTFHNKLGSQADRIGRIAALAAEIAPLVGASPDLAAEAARVAKADLQSAMVGEFPELQGIMGGYYARAAGLPEAVAAACKAHYQPLGPSDAVPSEPVSIAVALADKIDTLTGFWAIDEKPTGSKDPFALRRAALGVIRLVLASDTRMSLVTLSRHACGGLIDRVCRRGDSLLSNAEFYAPDDFMAQPLAGIEALRKYFVRDQYDEIALRVISSFLVQNRDKLSAFGDPVTYSTELKNFVGLSDGLNELSDLVREAPGETVVFNKAVDFVFARSETILKRDAALINFARLSDREALELIRSGQNDEISEFLTAIALDLLAFLHDRLKVFLRDQGIRHDVIDACLAPSPLVATNATGPGNDDLTLLVHRAEALAAFLKTDDGTNLLQGFKRANNILTQAEAKDGVEYSYGADPKFAEAPEEQALFAALDAAEAALAPAMQAEDFGLAMTAMAALRTPIDAFFDAVQVNSDKQVIRRNRLNLLSRIRTICLSVADLTKIDG